MNRSRTFHINALTIHLVEGDITQVETDALVVPLPSLGCWVKGIGVNAALDRVAGTMYHGQRPSRILEDLDTHLTQRTGYHAGKFEDVLFVIDNVEQPLNRVVIAALRGSNNAGYARIVLPVLRTDIDFGRIEKTFAAVAHQIALGLTSFTGVSTDSLKEVTFVVDGQEGVFDAMVQVLE